MTQELFWLFSSVNFVCMAVFTVVNILLTRKLSMRTNDLSKKTRDADAIDQRIKLTEKMNGYYNDYYALLGDEKTDKIFFEELDRFIKREISYIKERSS